MTIKAHIVNTSGKFVTTMDFDIRPKAGEFVRADKLGAGMRRIYAVCHIQATADMPKIEVIVGDDPLASVAS